MFRFLPYLIILFAHILIGQILPTVPGNVFRINIKTNLDNNINQNSKWVIGKQDFKLDKAGLNYFNNLVHNDSVRSLRLSICDKVGHIIKNSMGLLGIDVPERM